MGPGGREFKSLRPDHPHYISPQSGFGTGIIIALLLALSFGTAIFSALNTSHKTRHEHMVQAHNDLAYIQDTLDSFFVQHGYYPCPASPTASVTSASYGVSENCASGGETDTIDFNSSAGATPQLRFGSIPTRTLSIADRFMLDEWSNRYSYIVIENLAIDVATYNSFTSTDTLKFIQIDDPTVSTTPELADDIRNSPNSIVAYAIISHGNNPIGAYSNAGTQINCSGVYDREEENCDNDSLFYMLQPLTDENVAEADYFDDIVVWKMVK